MPARLHLIVHAFLLTLLLAAAPQPQAQTLPIPVADALKRADVPASAVGLYVQEVSTETGRAQPAIAAANPDTAFNPASLMKLVTTNAGLELLGPNFTWKTQAYATGPVVNGVLEGDLILKGSGDPKLVLENLWMFLRRIRAKGIQEIRGNLLLDRSVFEELPHDAAAFDGDPLKPYNVGPDALLVNYKALGIRFAPDGAGGVSVTTDPVLAGYTVTPPRLALGECGEWRAALRSDIGANGAAFPGIYATGCGEQNWYIHPDRMSHTQYVERVFRQLWRDLGGRLGAQVLPGRVSATDRLVAEWESPTLVEIIRDINKHSNNVMARQLLLTIAYQVLQVPANPEHGAAVVRAWLSRKGIDASEMFIENGSGLSRLERISARTLGQMLAAGFAAPTMPEFIASMPLAGVDGTMRRRLNGQAVAGRAHIKTGYLNDVRAIAGYVLAASGKYYAVVCIVNHPNARQTRELQDILLQWVYERG